MADTFDADDPYNLDRFVKAQVSDFNQALSEIKSGHKRSHWMWYIFPQLAGLGFSATSVQYAITNIAEADAYLSHPVLGPRLMECAEAITTAVPAGLIESSRSFRIAQLIG